MGDIMKDDSKTKKQLIHELTELRSQKAALEKSESAEKYRSLVENIRDVIYELDSQGVVLYISPAIRDMLGYDSSEIVGKNFIEIAYKDDLSSLAEWFSELRKGKESPSEYRVSNKSGEIRWARTKTRPIMEDGLFKGAQGILIDVTEQRRVEKALRESEAKYRLIAENTADLISILDMKLRFTYVSPASMRLRGFTVEEAMEQTLEQVLTPESMRLGLTAFEEEIQLEASGTADPDRMRILELEEYKKDGSIIWVEVSLSFLRGKDRKSVEILIVSRDITERKRAEEELRRNQDVAERLAQEIAIIAEIGKVIGSTLDTEEVYERFAAETQKLILFDSLAINLYNFQESTMCAAYVSGLGIDGRRHGDPLVLEGSLSEAVIRARTSLLIQPASIDEIVGQFPRLSPIFQAGLRSIMCVPLVYRDEVIGVLHFRSKKQNAYTEQDLRLAERIGEQIAGAIANAQLYAGLKKTEQELKESEQRYRELSIVDDLTQLYNSRHFYFQLKIELDRSNRYGQPLTLLLLDLDNFKVFNDAYGHVEGDQVLWRLGQVVKRCLRETDFAYRYGGEEFTILLPMTTGGAGAVTAERIRTEFKKETFSPAPGQDVHVTVSIGLAQYKPQEEMKVFVHRVDQLMYQGKKDGKDRVCSES
jgi:diguanylate cyclase (GGDEF)-like protein/PAS domain S-box-containing protein